MSEVLIGLDVGFGETKIVSSAKPDEKIIYPSFVHPVQRLSSKAFSLSEIKLDQMKVIIDDKDYLIGESAANYQTGSSKRTKAKNRAADESSQVLFKTAIAYACPDEDGEYDVVVTTGLPNSDYNLSFKEELEDFLSGSYEIDFVLSEERSVKKKINIISSTVMRQPEGSMIHNTFELSRSKTAFISRREKVEKYVGLIDIGHFTTDFALFNKGLIMENEERNLSTIAIDDVYRKISIGVTRYFSEMGMEYETSDADLDTIIRTKSLQFGGHTHDMTDIVEESIEVTVDHIIKSLKESWKSEINRVEAIYLTGGGSYALQQRLSERFLEEKIQSFKTVPNATMANSIGFYIYSCLGYMESSKKSVAEMKKKFSNDILEGEIFE